ncbi:MAG: ABC transporter permease subunit, partial [Deltaproteobacteria bacterium]|nr:ABC transporter permease subunit [Deltaproteobacteria bacterium]
GPYRRLHPHADHGRNRYRITLFLAFLLSYALTHTRFKGLAFCRGVALLPLFVPSLFPALGLLYLFGSQGAVTEAVGPVPLYGPLGIILGGIIYALPHALLPLMNAMRDIDADLYTAARTLGAGPWRRFFTVTLPGARYGLASSGIVVFVLTITDFGVPKVLGGDYAMLATEIFKQVVGMQDFAMGATVSLVLLVPCVPAFLLDGWVRRKQRFQWRGRPCRPEPAPRRDAAFTLLSWSVTALPLTVIGMVVWGSFISFWPYELGLTFANYGFENSVYGAQPFVNSVLLASATALTGVVLIFGGAYLAERCPTVPFLGGAYRLLAILPLAVPGTVLGLAYILAFNTAGSPMQAVYGTIPFLACNCVIHFYTVCHFTASGGLARLDPNYETVGATLGVSRPRTVWRVIIPMQKEVIADMAFYLFVNALTTISAVVFLYSPETMPASVAVLQMLDSGATAQASAMGTLILAAALCARLLRSLAGRAFRQ